MQLNRKQHAETKTDAALDCQAPPPPSIPLPYNKLLVSYILGIDCFTYMVNLGKTAIRGKTPIRYLCLYVYKQAMQLTGSLDKACLSLCVSSNDVYDRT